MPFTKCTLVQNGTGTSTQRRPITLTTWFNKYKTHARHSTKHGLDPWTGPKIGPKIGLKIGPKIGPKIGLKILAKILPKNPLFFRRETTLRISCFDLFV